MSEQHNEEQNQSTVFVEGNAFKNDIGPLNALSQMSTEPSLRNLCDVVFIVEGERFPAHRVVVAASSPVFQVMLTNGMRETSAHEIRIKSTDKATWELALRFMYTGYVEIDNREIAFNILRLAHHFEMNALVDIADRYFCMHFTEDGVFELFCLAEKYGLKGLMLICQRKLEKEFTTLSNEQGFKLLSFEVFDEILQKNLLKDASELAKFHAIRIWAGIPIIDDEEDIEITGDMKSEEAKKLLRNLRVDKMEASEIEVARKYPFVYNCHDVFKAFMKQTLSMLGVGKVAFGHKSPDRHKLTILLNCPETFWNSKYPRESPSTTDPKTGRRWKLQVFLQGKDNEGYLSVYLNLDSNGSRYPIPEKQEFQLFLLKRNRNETPYYKTFTRNYKLGGYGGSNLSGCIRFAAKDIVYCEGSEFISDEPRSLTFGANIF